MAEIDPTTVSYHVHEPLGVVGQINSLEFPAADGLLENSAGTGGGQLHRVEAGGANPGIGCVC